MYLCIHTNLWSKCFISTDEVSERALQKSITLSESNEKRMQNVGRLEDTYLVWSLIADACPISWRCACSVYVRMWKVYLDFRTNQNVADLCIDVISNLCQGIIVEEFEM